MTKYCTHVDFCGCIIAHIDIAIQSVWHFGLSNANAVNAVVQYVHCVYGVRPFAFLYSISAFQM